VRNALTVVEFLISILKKSARDERAFRLRVRDEVLPLIVRIPNRIDREHFEEVVSIALATTKEAVHYEVERIAETQSKEEKKAQSVSVLSIAPAAESSSVSAHTPRADTYRTDELVRFVYGIILWQEHVQAQEKKQEKAEQKNGAVFDSVEMSAVLKEAVSENAWQSLCDLGEPEQNKLIFEAEMHCAVLPLSGLLTLFHSYLKEIQERTLKVALREARAKLREAETVGDEEAMNKYLEACAVLQRRLSTIGSGFRE
jgi:hypothetical protein